MKERKLISMEEIEFKDVIHHTTTTKFHVIQRVKHLFGAPVVIKSEIKCENEPGRTESIATAIHTRVFKRRSKPMQFDDSNQQSN